MNYPNKLIIYGCSHSAPTTENSWSLILAKKLKLELINQSIPGMGIDGIFAKILNDYYQDIVDKNTLIILNTSYVFRSMSPFVYLYNQNKRPIDIKYDNHKSKKNLDDLLAIFKNNNMDNVYKQNSTFICDLMGICINWVQKTHLIEKLLFEKTNHVHQWTLDNLNTIEFIYNNIYDIENNRNLDFFRKHNLRFYDYSYNHKNLKSLKNIIPPPNGYSNFNDFVYDNSISDRDRHLNTKGHEIFAETIYNYLLKKGY